MNTSHRHYFQGTTNEMFGHQHRYYGETSEAPNLLGHFHEITGCTTKDNGHRHYNNVVTGPSIEVPGGHIHSYQGYTTVDQKHGHSVSGNTFANNYVPIARTSFTTQESKKIGEYLGIDWSHSPFDIEQFRTGLGVELEHGRRDPTTNVTDDDPITTGKIALAHLNEFPDYYKRLAKLEKEAKAFWKK
ncbi:MAG TPA: DUF5661 family protein [Candidatus Deferrimicrobium sp.]|nr:DUF5661 family protein [Candidatus Deferrimicrobium sp.]